jgi:hypothetical protein
MVMSAPDERPRIWKKGAVLFDRGAQRVGAVSASGGDADGAEEVVDGPVEGHFDEG